MTRVQAFTFLRLFTIAGSVIGAAVCFGAAVRLSGYQLIWNDSPSVPRGLYWVHRGAAPSSQHDYVVFYPSPQFAALIYGRNWLPPEMPLLKPVGGLEGDVYCVAHGRFTVNDIDIGPIFPSDSQGLAVPLLSGCRRVGHDEFLPVSSFLARSFDGRYMGAVAFENVIGTGRPLWTY